MTDENHLLSAGGTTYQYDVDGFLYGQDPGVGYNRVRLFFKGRACFKSIFRTARSSSTCTTPWEGGLPRR